MVRPLQNMIKKDVIFKWGSQENQSFYAIRQDIIEVLNLMSLDFVEDFTLYISASDRSYVAVLTQNNDDNNKIPILFMSSNFKGKELNYSAV